MTHTWIRNLRPHLWPVLLLVSAVFAVYGRTLGHEFLINWDDNVYVTGNEVVRGFSWNGIRTVFTNYVLGNYAPVHLLSYMLDYELWGLWPGGYLLTNIILHVMNGLLVYRLFLAWHGERLLAIVGAGVFLLHPVQVEAVAWVSQRKSLLAMLFFLLAWAGYCRYREAEDGRGKLAYAASVMAFALSLLAKPVTVILPVVLLLFDFCFPVPHRRYRVLDKVPFVLAAGAVAVLAVLSQVPEQGGGRVGYHGGSPWATFLTMLPVFCRYLGMIFWPAGLSAEYAPTIHRSVDAVVVGAALLLIAVGMVSVRLFRSDRRLGFWPCYFFIGLLPVSQIVPLVNFMHDRFLFFPMLGVAALAGSGAVYLRQRLGTGRLVPYHAALVLLMVALSVTSFLRVGVWRDTLTLWRDAVVKTPDKSELWERLGEVCHSLGAPTRVEALRAYKRALELNPYNTESLLNLGVLYNETGDYEKAHGTLTTLLALAPDHVMGWAAIGYTLQRLGEYGEAEKAYLRARELQPEAVPVLMFLGDLALSRGRLDQARDYYRQVEEKGGNNPVSAYRLACTESRAGHRDEARLWREKALTRGYRDYHNNRNDGELPALKECGQ